MAPVELRSFAIWGMHGVNVPLTNTVQHYESHIITRWQYYNNGSWPLTWYEPTPRNHGYYRMLCPRGKTLIDSVTTCCYIFCIEQRGLFRRHDESPERVRTWISNLKEYRWQISVPLRLSIGWWLLEVLEDDSGNRLHEPSPPMPANDCRLNFHYVRHY